MHRLVKATAVLGAILSVRIEHAGASPQLAYRPMVWNDVYEPNCFQECTFCDPFYGFSIHTRISHDWYDYDCNGDFVGVTAACGCGLDWEAGCDAPACSCFGGPCTCDWALAVCEQASCAYYPGEFHAMGEFPCPGEPPDDQECEDAGSCCNPAGGFSGLPRGAPSAPPALGPTSAGPSADVGGPINVITKNVWHGELDFPGGRLPFPLAVGRTYNSKDTRWGIFGYRWSSRFDIALSFHGDFIAAFRDGEGDKHSFARLDAGQAVYVGSKPGESLRVEADGSYSLEDRVSGDSMVFSWSGELLEVRNRAGNRQSF